MLRPKKSFFVVVFILFCSVNIQCQKAICIVPIADLVTDSFELSNPNCDIVEEYKNLPFTGEKGHPNCERVHQLLFNETVEILEELKYEIKVKISTTFFQTQDDKKNLHTSYYTLKENIRPINKISFEGNFENNAPESIDFNSTKFDIPNTNIVTLILPFKDTLTEKTYSAGTRFTLVGEDNDDYHIKIYSPLKNIFLTGKVSKKVAVKEKDYSNKEKIQNFVKLLKLWTSFKIEQECIPYVWGGVSFRNLLNFFKKRYKDYTPLAGFDCSGLILRAAQICQIPYFFKNTATLIQNLQTLNFDEEINDGDLLWFQGHVLIISDTQNNKILEARGYNSGFGRVHEIPLNRFFSNIKNYQELKDAYLRGTPLEIINNVQEPYLTIKKFKILKLDSVWLWNRNND